MLSDWEQGRSRGIERVLDLPDALEQDIIKTAPDIAPGQADFVAAARDDMEPSWATDPTERLRARFVNNRPNRDTPRLAIPDWLDWESGEYSHQSDAVAAWEASGTPERGTIAMATGAGKTLTALICATRLQDRFGSRPFLLLVSAPSIPLIAQWRDEVSKFGVTAVAPSMESSVDVTLTNLFRQLAAGGTQVLVVTNNMLCSPSFQSTVKLKLDSVGEAFATMLIADEAHSLGSEGFLNHRPEVFDRRLALSATPERQYDPDGTEAIFDFFGPTVYEFGLDRAIGFCLTPYNYYVHAGTLDGDELDEFLSLTSRIGAAMRQGLADTDDALRSLLIARRRIVETAHGKISLLRAVLERRGPHSIEHALVYASAKNPQQFDDVAAILSDLEIRWAPVTQETTANRSLLARTLATFTEGGYQVLLAKKVLDEGVDIPATREAFIVASSTVQREWIQRRGRVLRKAPGKEWALLHDFVSLPPAHSISAGGRTTMKKLIRSELDRAYSFAAHAQNATGERGALADLQRIRSAYWPEAGMQPVLQNAGDTLLAQDTPEGKPW